LPTDVLDTCTFLLPASMNIDKWCHRAFIRMAMLPKDHLLYKTMKSKHAKGIKHHHTALHHLLNAYNLDPNSIKKIPVAPRNPNLIGLTLFKISIPKTGTVQLEKPRMR